MLQFRACVSGAGRTHLQQAPWRRWGAVRRAATAARLVLQHTTHSLLAGAAADDFAVGMGLPRRNLSTLHSTASMAAWCDSRM